MINETACEHNDNVWTAPTLKKGELSEVTAAGGPGFTDAGILS